MLSRKTLPALPALPALLAAFAIACGSGRPPEPKDYATKIAADRAAKDSSFAGADDPIPRANHATFLPLAYFPIDPDYNVSASLKEVNDPTIIEMPTSAGGIDKFRRVGTLEFVLKSQPMKLTAFVAASAKTIDRLFVPFTDLTTGTETYSAGRYLDLDRTATGFYNIDFNRAYIPYCYYNPTYECPYPPRENRLQLPVRAGERVKQSASKSEVRSQKSEA
jgi:uncharacterized protein (DUF1684 family)